MIIKENGMNPTFCSLISGCYHKKTNHPVQGESRGKSFILKFFNFCRPVDRNSKKTSIKCNMKRKLWYHFYYASTCNIIICVFKGC